MTHSLSVADSLFQPERLFSVSEIRNEPSIVPAGAGIYGWWFSGRLDGVPLDGTLSRDGRKLLYVGIAPSGPASPGQARTRTLRDRLKNHCRGPIASSTLRRTIAAILASDWEIAFSKSSAGKLLISSQDEDRLTHWLDENAQVAWVECPEPWEVEE